MKTGLSTGSVPRSTAPGNSRALLQSSLYCNPEKSWNERFATWKTRFDSESPCCKTGIKKNIGQCIVSDTVSSPPPGTCGFSFDEGYLREMVNYYKDKRLKTQIDFFDTPVRQTGKKDNWFRKILQWRIYPEYSPGRLQARPRSRHKGIRSIHPERKNYHPDDYAQPADHCIRVRTLRSSTRLPGVPHCTGQTGTLS